MYFMVFTCTKLELCSVFSKDTPMKNPVNQARLKPGTSRSQSYTLSEPRRTPFMEILCHLQRNVLNKDSRIFSIDKFNETYTCKPKHVHQDCKQDRFNGSTQIVQTLLEHDGNWSYYMLHTVNIA